MAKYQDTQGNVIEVGSPELNPDLIAGKTLVSNTTPLGPITGADLTPITPITPITPESTPIYPVAGLDTTGQATPLPQETEMSSTIKRTQSLYDQLVGKSAFQAEQETTQGIPELQKTQKDLTARLTALKNEALAIPQQLQLEATGRGVTAGGLRPLETGALRTNAIQALGVASLLEASRGNLTTALDLVDRAVAQKYDPIEAQINANLKNLDLLSKDPTLTLAQQNRLEAQKEKQKERIAETERAKKDEEEIKTYAIEAARKGAIPDILSRIQSSKTPREALQIAGFYLGEDFRREVEDKQFQKSLQKATFNLSMDKFNEDKRQFSLEYALKQQEIANKALLDLQKKNPAIAAEATGEVLQNKINLIDTLFGHRGLNKAVGPSRLGRFTPFKIDVLSGDVQDFIAGVTQLVNKETIDTLVNLKARGGTLGALSDQERLLLQSAATKIGSWQLKDKNGNITGYNINETAFKKELESIKSLAITAKARALGGSVGETLSTEEDELRAAGYSDEQIRLLKQQ